MSASGRRPVVILHIGAMKTGTTFLQQVMIANRGQMAEAGFPFAGATWARQVRGVQDVLGLHQHDPKIQYLTRGVWRDLTQEMLAADGTSVLSMEFLSFAGRDGVRRIKHALADAEVHVVLTVRDAQATFPAQWQTSITSGATHAWGPFQRGVRRANGPGWRGWRLQDSSVRELRRTQDIPAIIARWLDVVPPSRMHVVTVPLERSDPMELWRRFCTPLGIDPAIATRPAKSDNASIGFASTELVRRVNVGLGEVPLFDYNRTIKDRLAYRILAKRRGQEERPRMDAATRRAALAWNARTVAAIERTGVNLVGDLTDLPTRADASVPPGPEMPTDAELFDAACDAAVGLVKLVNRRHRKLGKRGGAADGGAATLPGWVEDGHPADLDRAVADVTALGRRAVSLRGDLFELSQLRSE